MNQTIGQLVAARVTARGINHQTAATELGVSQTAFSAWAAGRSVPDEDRIPQLAEWLGMDIADVAMARYYSRSKRVTNLDEAFQVLGEIRSELVRLSARIDRLERLGDPGQ